MAIGVENPSTTTLHGADVLERFAADVAPKGIVRRPTMGDRVAVHDSVIAALPAGTIVESAFRYGMSLWGHTCKMIATLPNGEEKEYLLKTMTLPIRKTMIEGEFASLKAMHDTLPEFVPEPIAKGSFIGQDGQEAYFLVEEFRHIGEQPPAPTQFTKMLARFHQESVSPTGKFGFGMRTCNGKVPQGTDLWDDSWAVVYREVLRSMVMQDEEASGPWPEFKVVCDIVLDSVIPRLLEPLQSDGRSIKPCLVHGDLWDENTAIDMSTGEPFVFDPSSMYAHNEYELGNWRAARHRLSSPAYINGYKKHFPVSEPKNGWGDRNVLYSLRFNLGAAVMYPNSNMRHDVFDDMTILCKKFFPAILEARLEELRRGQEVLSRVLGDQEGASLTNSSGARGGGNVAGVSIVNDNAVSAAGQENTQTVRGEENAGISMDEGEEEEEEEEEEEGGEVEEAEEEQEQEATHEEEVEQGKRVELAYEGEETDEEQLDDGVWGDENESFTGRHVAGMSMLQV